MYKTINHKLFCVSFGLLGISLAHAVTVQLISPGGDDSVDGGLRITLDAYGGFGGSASPAGNAWFNPPGFMGSRGTVNESAVYLRGVGHSDFLAEGDIGGSGNLPSVSFTSTSDHSAVSAFHLGSLDFHLEQTVLDLFDGTGDKVGSKLIQTYQITNTGAAETTFSQTRYMDGDLFLDSTIFDLGGANTTSRSMDQLLYQFEPQGGEEVNIRNDSVLNSLGTPSDTIPYVGIYALGGSVPDHYFEISSYDDLRDKIISGGLLDNTIHGDSGDADLITDLPYNVSLALQRDFLLSPDEIAMFTTETIFGYGSPEAPPMPIPEPLTAWGAILGISVLGGYMRRRAGSIAK